METVAAVVLPIVAALLILGIMRVVATNARALQDEQQARGDDAVSGARGATAPDATRRTDSPTATSAGRGNGRNRP